MNAKHTPGPWYWHTDHTGNVSLRTPDRGNLIVMDCVRKGMNGATVRLAYWRGLPGGLPRDRLGGVMDAFDPEHPDAKLLAAAPELLDALRSMLALYEAMNAAHPFVDARPDKARELIARVEGGQ